MIKLSILDQSPVSEGMTHAQALQKTAELAIEAERLGYHRFWVSEHHAASNLAGSSPEVLITSGCSYPDDSGRVGRCDAAPLQRL